MTNCVITLSKWFHSKLWQWNLPSVRGQTRKKTDVNLFFKITRPETGQIPRINKIFERQVWRVHRFRKASSSKCLPHENEKLAFLNSSDLRNVFEKLRFHNGFVWTLGLTVKIKLRFHISPACGCCVRCKHWKWRLVFSVLVFEWSRQQVFIWHGNIWVEMSSCSSQFAFYLLDIM